MKWHTWHYPNRIYWLVNLNSTVIFLGIAYIQQSVGKNLGFLIPFTSVLLGLIGIHMACSNLILHPKKGSIEKHTWKHKTYTVIKTPLNAKEYRNDGFSKHMD